jgi:RNA polymerase sigma-70 factor (ECF subfamily)
MSHDAALIRRSHSGDASAFAELVDLHSDDIFTLCLRVLGETKAAEDTAEQVFVSAHQAIFRLSADTPIKPWLFQQTIAAMSARHEDEKAGAPPRDTTTQTDPQSDRVGTLIRSLEWPFRLAVVLRDVMGLSLAEVAAALELPIGTVRSRVHRGRLTMARDLAKPTQAR